MIFKQLFDSSSSTYTYLLATAHGGKALLIDPVKEHMDQYRQLLAELDVELVYAIDTHTHADHITALGDLRDMTGCITIMGDQSKAACVSQYVKDGERLSVGDICLQALYTPGHTHESFCFVLNPDQPVAVFTGDALLIRGTGRTDFQGGDAGQSWDSIMQKLFSLPDHTVVYPAHDYKGCTSSTIGDEKRLNPRLAGKTREEYIETMNALNLPSPKMMDVAVPANLACGQTDR
ncbi:MBL fold metallo-hydrolase [Allopusillimonas ginsengisoli]|uniref:MBL fold metallo-hydrolase n=1 Tax=Allopusillimonas ginsengisoli TaxID=453575 RepID=UPI00101F8CC4|nr:MBL fold metallo-hydrolase [Allopusillimonas ginsengisoli]TEA76869.1 MBL fold metallo-hydrolase [Allopusillimonas ginsengisoli]